MKNKTKKRIGIAAAMLGVVVAIGATAGTTLAKYITSATVATQQATVAAWGYTVTTNAEKLFSKTYDNGKIVEADNTTIDVKASSEVVAPGTSSEGTTDGELTFTINGSAEVDAQLIIDISAFDTVWLKTNSVKTGENTTLGTADEIYYPLKWTITADNVDDNKVEVNFTAGTDMKHQLAATIAEYLPWSENFPTGATVNAVAANDSKVVVNLPMGTTVNNLKLTIGWEWPFTQIKDESAGTNYDVEDTVLGWLAYNKNATTKVQNGTSYNGVNEVTVSGIDSIASTDYNLIAKIGCSVQVVQVQSTTQNPKF